MGDSRNFLIMKRATFWVAVTLLAAIWVLALGFGGRDFGPDIALYNELYVSGDSAMGRNAVVFTHIGDGAVLTVLALAAAAWTYAWRKRRTALLLITVFVGRFLVEIQKWIIDRPRPGVSPHLVMVDTSSFPSGHAANAMITYLAIGLLLPVRQRNRAIAVGIGLAFALQVGISRVMLGVHWPSDVIGGWAFGLLWIMACMRLASSRPEGA